MAVGFDKFHVLIMGFTQSTTDETGMERLWKRMRPEINLANECLLEPKVWNERFGNVAEFIFRNLKPGGTVNVVCYSWGAGHGAVKLCRELNKRGIIVSDLLACDPVYHSWLRPWRGMFPAIWNGPIAFPANVMRARSFIQRLNTPQGTGIRLANPRAVVDRPIELRYDHNHIDDADEFHELAIRIVKGEA